MQHYGFRLILLFCISCLVPGWRGAAGHGGIVEPGRAVYMAGLFASEQSRWQARNTVGPGMPAPLANRTARMPHAISKQPFAETPHQRAIHIQPLPAPPIKSIRGMSVVSDRVVWVSGTGGQVGRSVDGGRSWQWIKVPGRDSCDWRSIAAFSDRKAVVLNAGEPAYIMLTENGGRSWEQVYYNNEKGIFFDGIAFRNSREGLAIGDPMNGRFMVIYTRNGGRSWQAAPEGQRPPALEGEAIFAASGTSIRALPGGKAAFVTGGAYSRFISGWRQWQATALPLAQGGASEGAFSFAFLDAQRGVAVGGNYSSDTVRAGNCAFTTNGGRGWQASPGLPYGYRSCVQYLPGGTLIATGTSGTDLSFNGGRSWQNISREGYHTAGIAPGGKRVFLAGSGKMAFIDL